MGYFLNLKLMPYLLAKQKEVRIMLHLLKRGKILKLALPALSYT